MMHGRIYNNSRDANRKCINKAKMSALSLVPAQLIKPDTIIFLIHFVAEGAQAEAT
jgi:hypothetical protein